MLGSLERGEWMRSLPGVSRVLAIRIFQMGAVVVIVIRMGDGKDYDGQLKIRRSCL